MVTLWIIKSNVSKTCSYSKTIHGSGISALTISNKEMEDIMKIVKSLEESKLFIKQIVKQLKIKQKNNRWISSNNIKYSSC